jgi:hypothetical protein
MLVALSSTGCGPTIYTAKIASASRAVEQARVAGAPEDAPYEYYYAEAHLHKAREEAGESSYQDAIDFARTATEYGRKARDLSRRRMREEGR